MENKGQDYEEYKVTIPLLAVYLILFNKEKVM